MMTLALPVMTYSRRSCRRCGADMQVLALRGRRSWHCGICGRTER